MDPDVGRENLSIPVGVAEIRSRSWCAPHRIIADRTTRFPIHSNLSRKQFTKKIGFIPALGDPSVPSSLPLLPDPHAFVDLPCRSIFLLI